MSRVVDSSTGASAGFPAPLFTLDGEPSAIRGSAREGAEFGTQATEASAQIRSLDTSLFIGPEGEQYRDGLSHNLVPHLQTTGQAYSQVGRALDTFARLVPAVAPPRMRFEASCEPVSQPLGRCTG